MLAWHKRMLAMTVRCGSMVKCSYGSGGCTCATAASWVAPTRRAIGSTPHRAFIRCARGLVGHLFWPEPVLDGRPRAGRQDGLRIRSSPPAGVEDIAHSCPVSPSSAGGRDAGPAIARGVRGAGAPVAALVPYMSPSSIPMHCADGGMSGIVDPRRVETGGPLEGSGSWLAEDLGPRA